jgi:hypothetical protein
MQQCGVWLKFVNVSVVHTASIFRVDKLAKQGANDMHSKTGSMLLKHVSEPILDYTA